MENDPFENSLRELLREQGGRPQTDKVLRRVLKTANRRTGMGALLMLSGRALESVLVGLEYASAHWKPVSRLTVKTTEEDKAD